MKRRISVYKTLSPLLLVGVWACYNAPVETPAPKVNQETDVKVQQNVKNKVDILFMIDNSPSMSPKQQELKNRFPLLIKTLNDFGKANPASYHIAVVTSDLGAGQFNIGNGQCHPGGDGAKLQAVGAAADSQCQPPGMGLPYIVYDQLANQSNLPSGTAQDPASTATDANGLGELEWQFDCMASVGDKGCGFEQQLEAPFQALHQNESGFLRDDALLVVVWITDEDDDCSSPPDSDLFDPSQTQYGALLSYRGTNYGVMCQYMGQDSLMPYADSGGALMSCHGAPNPNGNSKGLPPSGQGKCYDTSRYINYLTKPAAQGGVKVDPNDVILVGIVAPPSPVESILANPSPQPPGPYTQCPGPIDGKTCAVVLQHSCIASTNTSFFGDPAVRISEVINSSINKQLTSICDTSYQAALQSLGQLIISKIGAGCIDSPFEDPTNPDCIVENITANNDGSTTITEVPSCTPDAQGNVTASTSAPCWELQSKPICGNGVTSGCCDATQYSPPWPTSGVCVKDGDAGQHFGVSICYNNQCNGGSPPPNTNARVACSTVAVTPNLQTGLLPMCGAPL